MVERWEASRARTFLNRKEREELAKGAKTVVAINNLGNYSGILRSHSAKSRDDRLTIF